MKQYVLLTLLSFSVILGIASIPVHRVWGTTATDPQGDTFGHLFPQLDISSMDAKFDTKSLTFQISFFTPIAPPSANAANSVVGFIDIDSDRNPSTGATSFIDIFGIPPSGLGDEFFIYLFSESSNPGNVAVYNTLTQNLTGVAPISFTSNSLTITVPVSLLGGNSLVNYGTIIGTFSEPTDQAPNSCCATSEQKAPPVQTTLTVSPTVNTAPKGGVVSVNINVANTTGLFAFHIFLTFDPTLLSASAPPIDSGNVLQTYCSQTPGCLGISSKFSSGPGFVEAQETIQGNVSGFSGSGLVITIALKASKGSTGTTVLHIASDPQGQGNGSLSAFDGQPIQHSSLDGIFSNGKPDLFISPTPNSLTLQPEGNTSAKVTLYPLNGLTGAALLTLTGVPTGVAASFGQASLILTTPSVSTSLKITAGLSAIPGNFTLTITGSVISPRNQTVLVRTAFLGLMVLPPTPDFTVSVNPSRTTIPRGGSGSLTVIASSIQGFRGSVALSFSGTFFVTGSFNIDPVTLSVGGNASSVLTLFVDQFAPEQTLGISVAASAAGITHTATFTLAISGFQLLSFPLPTLQPGAAASTTIVVLSLNGFSGTVQLSVINVPEGVAPTLNPTTVTLSGSNNTEAFSTLTVLVSNNAQPRTSTMIVLGTSSGQFSAAPAEVTITDFQVTPAAPVLTVPVFGSASSTIFASSLNGFSGFVFFDLTGVPSGVSVSLSPSFSFLAPESTSSVSLNVTANGLVKPGDYGLTIVANSGPTSHSTKVTLRVTDFAISASSTALSIGRGGTAELTLTLSPVNGFSSPVTLTVTGIPAGVNATFTPSIVGPPATSTLTLAVGKKPALGTFTIVVVANSGSLVRTLTITLTITK